MEGKLIIFSAPSGAGKTTIVKYLLGLSSLKLEFSISATSREPRGTEINGKDYYFMSAPEFKEKIEKGEFVEWEEVYKNQYYGTLKTELERIWIKGNNVVFDVDVVGGVNLKKQFGDLALSVFVMPPSIEELKKRLAQRSTDTNEQIAKRLAKAEEELSFSAGFDKVLVNDKLEEAKSEAVKIVSGFLGA